MQSTLLTLHIALGAVALVLGPVAMWAAKRRGLHTRTGEAYHWVVLGVCLTAIAVAVTDWARLWWFVPVALASYAFARLGYAAAKVRWRGWLVAHLSGQGGSYPWILPTLVGTPLIAWINTRLRRRPLV